MKRLLVALALVCSTAFPTASRAAGPAVDAGVVTFEIGGAPAGVIRPLSAIGYTRLVDGKVVAQPTPMPVDFRVGFNNKEQLAWVAAFANGTASPKTLDLGFATPNLQLKGAIELPDFSITELTISACDIDEELAPGWLTVRGNATEVTKVAASGQVPQTSLPDALKVWRVKDFRVSVSGAGLDASRIASLGPIKVRRGPQGLEIAPIEVKLSGAIAAPWDAWAEKTLVKGESDERTVKVELLLNEKISLLTIELTGVSPVERVYSKGVALLGSQGARRFVLAAKGIKLSTGTKVPKVNATLPSKSKG